MRVGQSLPSSKIVHSYQRFFSWVSWKGERKTKESDKANAQTVPKMMKIIAVYGQLSVRMFNTPSK